MVAQKGVVEMNNSASEVLQRWQRSRLETVHSGRKDYGKGSESVTILVYYWGAEVEKPDTQFYRIESAFRETWLNCGMMKSVIVTDKPTKDMERFAETFPLVEIQVEPKLVPGDIFTMSQDCDANFERRFNTEYLMVIQDDGFPLRQGLEKFLGKWDFIGAPYVRDMFLARLRAWVLNLWVANGGFSIRTHRMCEMAADYWRKKWHVCKDPNIVGEDAYYTSTLLKHEWRYNRTMKMADTRSAIDFAYDIIVPQPIKKLPFGFHRAETFADFLDRGWVK